MNRTFKLICIFAAVVLLFTIIPFVTFSGTTGTNAPAGTDNNSGNAGEGTGSTEDRLKDAIVLYVGSPVAYVNGKETRIDATDSEVTPVIRDNVRMVPLRFIAESFGAKVDWDGDTLMASLTIGSKTYKFKQGSNILTVGNTQYELDIPVQTVKSRTFVPLGKFVEILGKKAFYDRGLIIISDKENILDPISDKAAISELVSRLSYLPVVGSYEKLKELLEEAQENGIYLYGDRDGRNAMKTMDESAAVQDVKREAKAKESAAAADAGSADYSTTNVQVQGVDEADIVKTDGQYIYQVNRQRVVVARANPPENMKLVSTLNYSDRNFAPIELYLHDDKLIVIGASRTNIPVYKEKDGVKVEIYPAPKFTQRTTKALIYDMSDRGNIKLLREIELEGRYVSSRKIGPALYIIANDYVDYYRIQKEEINTTPSYRDTQEADGYKNIDYASICYFPGMIEPNYMIAAGINVDGNEAANVSTYLGAGQNIYASTENLYVAVANYRAGGIKPLPDTSVDSGVKAKVAVMPEYEENTLLYKFALKEAKVTYLSKGEVPGTILNQFSMDETGGSFRIATTRGDMWRTDEKISKNNLYILDDMFSITGKVEDMAPGEKIYSVRFMGDRAYVVTFKTVDPLFVIDLKDPSKPSILGALKIPGYSDYLHPYDENHIIGFGKDTVEIKGQAYYLGMKIALFDVTDVSKPVQKFSEVIGDRGTDSALLNDHKALLFSKEKNLLAFPVTVMEVKNSSEKVKRESLQYGEFAFQGAYVYSLDLTDGFKLRGKITHLSDEDYLKAGNDWYESDKNVQRILYIGDTLYTLSNSVLKANGLRDLKEKGSVVIP